jgi:hypothetical protein
MSLCIPAARRCVRRLLLRSSAASDCRSRIGLRKQHGDGAPRNLRRVDSRTAGTMQQSATRDETTPSRSKRLGRSPGQSFGSASRPRTLSVSSAPPAALLRRECRRPRTGIASRLSALTSGESPETAWRCPRGFPRSRPQPCPPSRWPGRRFAHERRRGPRPRSCP